MQSGRFNKLLNELCNEAFKTNQPLVVLFGDEDHSETKCIGNIHDPHIRSHISDLEGYTLRQAAQRHEELSIEE